MAEVFTHIGEILARNARMYPNDVALVERTPAEKKRVELTWKQLTIRRTSSPTPSRKWGQRGGQDRPLHEQLHQVARCLLRHHQNRGLGGASQLPFHFGGRQVLQRCRGTDDHGLR